MLSPVAVPPVLCSVRLPLSPFGGREAIELLMHDSSLLPVGLMALVAFALVDLLPQVRVEGSGKSSTRCFATRPQAILAVLVRSLQKPPEWTALASCLVDGRESIPPSVVSSSSCHLGGTAFTRRSMVAARSHRWHLAIRRESPALSCYSIYPHPRAI